MLDGGDTLIGTMTNIPSILERRLFMLLMFCLISPHLIPLMNADVPTLIKNPATAITDDKTTALIPISHATGWGGAGAPRFVVSTGMISSAVIVPSASALAVSGPSI